MAQQSELQEEAPTVSEGFGLSGRLVRGRGRVRVCGARVGARVRVRVGVRVRVRIRASNLQPARELHALE